MYIFSLHGREGLTTKQHPPSKADSTMPTSTGIRQVSVCLCLARSEGLNPTSLAPRTVTKQASA